MSWDFLLPTREGGAVGSALEGRMLNKVGGPNSIRTEIQRLPDGSEVMLRTRGGHPEFTVKPAVRVVIEALDEYIVYGRVIANTYPWGVATSDAGVQTTPYSHPGHPISKATMTSAGGAVSFVEDTSLTDSIGSCRWVDTRSVPATSKILTWEPMTGSTSSIPEPSYMSSTAYFDLFGAANPTFASATPGNAITSYKAGRRFFGQRDFEGGGHRIVPAFGSARRLYINGEASPIQDKIVAAGIFFSGATELVRIFTVDGFYSGTSHPRCNELRIKTFTLSGGYAGISTKVVSLPEGYVAIASIDIPPALNSGGTQAVMACTLLIPGYSFPTDAAYRKSVVLTIECSTGVASVFPIGGKYGSVTTINGGSGPRPAIDPSAAVNSYEYSTETRTNIVVAVGYVGDDVLVLRNEFSSVGGWAEINTRAKHPTINIWADWTHDLISTQTRASKFIMDPAGTTVYENSAQYDRVDRTDRHETWIVDEDNNTRGDLVDIDMTNTIFSQGFENGGDTVVGVCVDFTTGVAAVLRVAKKNITSADGVFTYTFSQLARYKVFRSRPQYSRTTQYNIAVDLVDLASGGKQTVFQGANAAFSSTLFAAVEDDEDIPQALRYDAGTWEIETMPLTSSVLYDGANRTTPLPIDGGVDGMSLAVSPDGKIAVISILHGRNFNSDAPALSDIAATTIIAKRTGANWSVANVDIQAPDGEATWLMETAIFKKGS